MFEKEETSKKGCVEIKRLRLLCTLSSYWGLKKIPFTFYTYVLDKILQMVQSLYKNWLLVSKITWGIWATLDKSWKVQKVEIGWHTFVQKIHLSKKCISLAKTLYTKDLSNITFNYLCKKFTKLLMSFLKLYVICYDTTPLYFVGLNITYFLQK